MIATISSALVSAHYPSLFPELKFSKFTHLYFKRYEPQSPKHVLSILFGVPSFLSLLKAYVAGTSVSALSTSSLLGTFVVYFATLIGSIAVYRTSPFHPLAKYPGPFIAKLSKMWMVDSFPVFYIQFQGLTRIYSSLSAQLVNRTNTSRTYTRNTGMLCAQVN